MSEARCKGFKESQKKAYVETVKGRVLIELHKRREALINKLRDAYFPPTIFLENLRLPKTNSMLPRSPR